MLKFMIGLATLVIATLVVASSSTSSSSNEREVVFLDHRLNHNISKYVIFDIGNKSDVGCKYGKKFTLPCDYCLQVRVGGGTTTLEFTFSCTEQNVTGKFWTGSLHTGSCTGFAIPITLPNKCLDLLVAHVKPTCSKTPNSPAAAGAAATVDSDVSRKLPTATLANDHVKTLAPVLEYLAKQTQQIN